MTSRRHVPSNIAPKRKRADASPDDVASALRPFVHCKRWLSYTEQLAGKVDKVAIKSKAPLLQKLMDTLDGNLSITQNDAKAAFGIIASEKMVDWKLDEKMCKEWASSMSKRLRAMLRHTSQALLKPNAWALELFGDQSAENVARNQEEQEEEEEEKEESQDDAGDSLGTEAHAEPQTIADFCFEHHEAYRHLVPVGGVSSRSRVKKEWTNMMFNKTDNDSGKMWARWPDGSEAQLQSLILSQWRNIQDGRKRGRRPPVWEAQRQDGQRVCVVFRAERPGASIYAILGGGKQVTQVLLHRFGDETSPDADLKAKNVAIELAKKYAQENFDKSQLIQFRETLLPPKGDAPVRKRPAAQTRASQVEPSPPVVHGVVDEDDMNDDDDDDDENAINEQNIHGLEMPLPPEETLLSFACAWG